MKNSILWQKYRPTTLEEIILPERIRKLFENGELTTHSIFVGKSGCGKSTLANILTKKNSVLKINASKEGGIDTLRNEIDDFCTKYSIGHKKSDIKNVYLDEMDRTTEDFQTGLNSYMEDERFMDNVIFVGTANKEKKIITAQLSRFRIIKFNPKDLDEEKYLINEYYKRCKNVVLVNEGIVMQDDDLKKIIRKNFPDFRSILDDIQYFRETGELNNPTNTNTEIKTGLYDIIFSNDDNEKIYHFLNNNFGDEKITDMLSLLGRPFFEWCCINKRDKISALLPIMKTITDYNSILLTSCSDPLVLGLTVIGEIRRHLE